MIGPARACRGVVASYDDAAGMGEVRDDAGVDYPFHCTEIADRTRSIEPGAIVLFDVVAGRLGRWEAAELRPAGPTVNP